jgi:hypothetical protein
MKCRPPTQCFALALAILVMAGGCTPPPLTAAQEALVGECLELAHRQESNAECTAHVTRRMEKAYLGKHPDFYQQLLAKRKAFVEERIAEDQRRRDELNRCLDTREAGGSAPVCEQFMTHELERGIEDRRRRRCARARLDGAAHALRHCQGLSDRDIEQELQMERFRRERRRPGA